MFFFCKKSTVDVTFFTDNPSAFNFAKPDKAAKFLPEWWKKLPKTFKKEGEIHQSATIKSCPGVIDLYSRGFIQPLWSDLSVKITPDGAWKYQFSDRRSEITNHSEHQLGDNTFTQKYTHLKIRSPWVAREKTNLSFMLAPPFWNVFGFDEICIASGVIGFRVPMELNINMFVKRYPEPVVHELHFGQPLTHFVPLSDKTIKYKHELVDEKELSKIRAGNGLGMSFVNRWRKVNKLCPYA